MTVLAEASLGQTTEANFLKAQALSALSRWNEALPLYEKVAADQTSPVRAEALLGQAESLRALGRIDEALAIYAVVARDSRWSVRAHLRAAELLLARNDALGAARELSSFEAKTAGDRRERRYLRGCIETEFGNKKRATALFASILKSPRGASHSVLLATLFALAETHLRAGTPETGDDFLEDFIEHHPDDSALARDFREARSALRRGTSARSSRSRPLGA